MNALDSERSIGKDGRCIHCGGSGREQDALPVEFLPAKSPNAETWGNMKRLAEAIDRDSTTISKIVNGRTAPGLITAILIARHLGVSVDRVIMSPKIRERIGAVGLR